MLREPDYCLGPWVEGGLLSVSVDHEGGLVDTLLPAFSVFISELRAIWAEESDDARRMAAAKPVLERLVVEPTLQEHARRWPSTEGHKNLLLHDDQEFGFVVNAVVRTGPRSTPPTHDAHDHATAWVLYGLVEGSETLQRFDRLDDGSVEGHAEIRLRSADVGVAGQVDLVPPFDPHSEIPGARRSVAVIIRSEKLVGIKLQGRYDMATSTRTEGMGPTQVPFEVAAALPVL